MTCSYQIHQGTRGAKLVPQAVIFNISVSCIDSYFGPMSEVITCIISLIYLSSHMIRLHLEMRKLSLRSASQPSKFIREVRDSGFQAPPSEFSLCCSRQPRASLGGLAVRIHWLWGSGIHSTPWHRKVGTAGVLSGLSAAPPSSLRRRPHLSVSPPTPAC